MCVWSLVGKTVIKSCDASGRYKNGLTWALCPRCNIDFFPCCFQVRWMLRTDSVYSSSCRITRH